MLLQVCETTNCFSAKTQAETHNKTCFPRMTAKNGVCGSVLVFSLNIMALMNKKFDCFIF